MCIRHHIVILLGIVCFWQCCELCAGKGLKGRYTTEHPLVFEDAWEKWPYSFINAEREPDGFDAELVRRALARLEIPYQIRLRSQDSVFLDLKNGRADLTFGFKMEHYLHYGKYGNVTITQAQTCLMVPKKDSVACVTIDELRNMNIMVGRGSNSFYYLADHDMIDSLVRVEDHLGMAILDMVSRGEGGAMWNAVMLRWLIKRYDIKGYALVSTDIPTVEYRFMSNDEELLHALDSVSLKMHQEGIIDEMKLRWIYPENRSNDNMWQYGVLSVAAVVLLLAFFVLWMRHRHMYHSHKRFDDIRNQMELVLTAADGVKVWAYSYWRDVFAWITPDGQVEHDYSVFEFSQFFDTDDFMAIHEKIAEIKDSPGEINTILLHDGVVSMQAVVDDYGKPYMVCGVMREGSGGSSGVDKLRSLAEEMLSLTKQMRCWLLAVMMLALGSGSAMAYHSSSQAEPFFPDSIVVPIPHKHLHDKYSQKSVEALPIGLRYTKQHPLIVVCDWNFAPFSFRNLHGEPDGLLVELIKEIFSLMRVPYEIKMVEWHKAKQMMYSGEAHLMMDIRTPDDTTLVSYGSGVLAEYKVAVARLKTTPPLHSIELLTKNDTIYTYGGVYSAYWMRLYYNGNIPFTVMKQRPYNAITEILAGREKYYMFSHAALRHEIRRFSLWDEIEIEDIDVMPGEFNFVTTDKQLQNELNQQFQALRESGFHQRLLNKWLTDEGGNTKEMSGFDILAIISILILFVGVTVVMVFILQSNSTANLKREFRAIAHIAVKLTGCNVLAINVKRSWVYNVAGDLLPPKGLSMDDYKNLIHPDDRKIEKEARHRVNDGERNMPVVYFRIRKYNGAPDDWHTVSVHAHIKAGNKKLPAYVYLAMIDEQAAHTSLPSPSLKNSDEIRRHVEAIIDLIETPSL